MIIFLTTLTHSEQRVKVNARAKNCFLTKSTHKLNSQQAQPHLHTKDGHTRTHAHKHTSTRKHTRTFAHTSTQAHSHIHKQKPTHTHTPKCSKAHIHALAWHNGQKGQRTKNDIGPFVSASSGQICKIKKRDIIVKGQMANSQSLVNLNNGSIY